MATKPAIYTPTQDELANTLAQVIARVAGGSAVRCRKLIEPIERLPTGQFVRFNWRVSPKGSEDERDIVQRGRARAS